MSEVKVNKISPRSGTAITLGDSGDTFTIPSGATLAIAGSVTGFTSAGIDDNATSVAITIDSSENVGIGSTTPSTDAWSGANSLVIKDTSGDNGLTIISSSTTNNGNIAFADSSGGSFSDIGGLITYLHNGDSMRFMTANAERMRITSTGLGIGTSSPSRQLTVSGSTAPVIAIVDTGTSGTPSLFFGDSSADNVGKIQYANSNNSLATVVNGSERMRIDSSGNVGISNTTPGDFNSQARNLVIGGGSGDTGMTIYSGSGSGDTGNIFFADGTSGSDQVRGGITYNHGDNSMNFRTNDGANRIYISSAGNVGINTSSPSVKLHILGTENNADTQAIRLMENSTQGGFIKYDGNTNELQLGGYNSGENTGIKIARNDATTMFNTGGSERMRIDSSGRAMIGTTTADGILAVSDTNNETYLVVQNAKSGGSGEAVLSLKNDVGNYQVKCFTDDSFRIRDNTNSTDRLMISSGGTVFVSNTSEPSAGDNGAQISNSSYHIFCRNTSGAAVFRTFGSSGEFRTLGNGNAQNTNNSYGAISDRELKENEVDANSQWNDIKSLQIKHYNFKSKPNEKQLGVIAQDLEASGMNGLVENNQDELYTEDDVLPEGKNIGDVKLKNYKSVKYSILYMKSVKALQEAMERIETLEAKVTALETTTP